MVDLQAPAISIAIATQPDSLKKFVSNLILQGKGMPSRFIFALPKDKVGYRNHVAHYGSEHTAEAYRSKMTELLKTPCERNEFSGEIVSTVVKCERGVDEALREFKRSFEADLRDEGSLAGSTYIKGLAGKSAGFALRIATLFALAEGLDPSCQRVTVEHFERGRKVMEYALAHAKIISGMTSNPTTKMAMKITEYIKRHKLLEIKRTKICHDLHLEIVDCVGALELLAEHGILIPKESSQKSFTGRKATDGPREFYVNPTVHAVVKEEE
jgi:hypothetical protein